MGIFRFFTYLGAISTVISFLCGTRAESPMGYSLRQRDHILAMWEFLFYAAVFLTILSAPLAH